MWRCWVIKYRSLFDMCFLFCLGLELSFVGLANYCMGVLIGLRKATCWWQILMTSCLFIQLYKCNYINVLYINQGNCLCVGPHFCPQRLDLSLWNVYSPSVYIPGQRVNYSHLSLQTLKKSLIHGFCGAVSSSEGQTIWHLCCMLLDMTISTSHFFNFTKIFYLALFGNIFTLNLPF